MTASQYAASELRKYLPPTIGDDRPIIDGLIVDMILALIKRLTMNCGYVDPVSAHRYLTEDHDTFLGRLFGRERRRQAAIRRAVNAELDARGTDLSMIRATAGEIGTAVVMASRDVQLETVRGLYAEAKNLW